MSIVLTFTKGRSTETRTAPNMASALREARSKALRGYAATLSDPGHWVSTINAAQDSAPRASALRAECEELRA